MNEAGAGPTEANVVPQPRVRMTTTLKNVRKNSCSKAIYITILHNETWAKLQAKVAAKIIYREAKT